MSEFQDRVVCVAGASRGIGSAAARAFAERGARLLLLSRSQKAMSSTDVISAPCDIRDYEAVRQNMELAAERWGRLDVLVNTAAVLGATGPLSETDPEEWAKALDVNLRGTYNTMRAAIPLMKRGGGGRIVNFAGGGAAYAYPRFSAYAASKAAVVRLTETAAVECEADNIRINVVAPGAIETDLLREVRSAGGEVRTIGSMKEALELVLYLASEGSGRLTGRFIHARDDYREWPADLPADRYTLRRVQP